MPIKKEQPVIEFREVSKDEKKFKAFATLRKVIVKTIYFIDICYNYKFFHFQARTDARLVGIRAKQARENAENEDPSKKK